MGRHGFCCRLSRELLGHCGFYCAVAVRLSLPFNDIRAAWLYLESFFGYPTYLFSSIIVFCIELGVGEYDQVGYFC